MSFRQDQVRMPDHKTLKRIPNLSQNIKFQILTCINSKQREFPFEFKIVFQKDLCGLLKGLIKWRK